MFVAVEFIDIMVPRNSGTCSNTRLLEAMNLIEENIHARNRPETESQKAPKLKYAIDSKPMKNVDMIATFFLPSLFTKYPPERLPMAKQVEVPMSKREA